MLWRFLAIAAHEPDEAAARATQVVAAHLAGWPRKGDFGVVAERAGDAIGAAWARQFLPAEEPSWFAGPDMPEISIGVAPAARGQGVGLALLHRLTEMARARRCAGLCLNVRDSNPARRLYARAGFRLVEGVAIPNRVGGVSVAMRLDLPP